MLKTLNMALIRCPVGIPEEILAVFQMKKISNWHRKWQKNPKISIFQSFYAFFVKLLTDFVNWKVLKGEQWKGWLSSSLFWRVYCIFQNENVSNWHRIWQKFQKVLIFKGSGHFFPNFRRTLWIGTLKRVNKERMWCSIGFSDEFIAAS